MARPLSNDPRERCFCVCLRRETADRRRRQCPECGLISTRVSPYQRRLTDLPVCRTRGPHVPDRAALPLHDHVVRRSIFTGRLGDDVLAPGPVEPPRRSCPSYLALALDGRPRARLAHRLIKPVSNDPLLRVLRRYGLDDWTWKRNQRYGALICDLERRRPIKLDAPINVSPTAACV